MNLTVLTLKSFLILFCVVNKLEDVKFKSHDYYVSTTQLEYISEKDVIQITIKIFKDDIESVISQKNQTISDSDLIQINRKLNEYIIEKFRISVNNDNMILDFIGKEYKKDMIQIYYEVKLVEKIKKIIIENNLLFDLIDNQQNIIHFKNENFRKSFLFTKNNSKSILFIK